jgi:hypothetical protein
VRTSPGAMDPLTKTEPDVAEAAGQGDEP